MGQKQAASELSVQPVSNRKVFKHEGTTPGQGRGLTGAVETGAALEVVSTAAAEELATLPAEVGTTTPVLISTAEETTAEEATADD